MNGPAALRADPYLLLGESRTRLLHERLLQIIERWYQVWAPERAGELFAELTTDVGGHESHLDGWGFTTLRAEETVLQALVRTDFLRILSGVGPGEGVFTTAVDSPQGSVAAALTVEIITALCLDIARAALPAAHCTVQRLDMQSNEPMAARRRARAQLLTVSIATDKARPAVVLVLMPALIDALLAARPAVAGGEPIAGRRSASAEQPVALSAVLGSATVSWRELTDLRVGDVIVLDQTLSAPCVLHVGGTAAVADAQLGHIDNVLSAQVTRIRPAAS